MLHIQLIKKLPPVFLFLISFTTYAQQVTVPRVASPAAVVSQTIGISAVSVNYARPSVKNRKIWGALVPYGWNKQAFGTGNEAPWRAGANENTTISFSHNARVEGKAIPAGLYGLFFVINKDNTGEVILSRDHKSWGSFFYDAKQDVLRANIKLRNIPFTDQLSYDFIDVTKNSGELVLNWEQKQFPVKIEFDVDNIVMQNAEEELKGPTGFTWQGFSSAANYAMLNNTSLDKADKWIDAAIAQHKSFATLQIKSGILKQLNKTAEAELLMKDAIAIATENELNLYGYQLINQAKNDKAIEIFTLNTKRFPQSANTWDSLGEGYFLKGDHKNAAACFKKCLSMNPPDNVKANSEKYMKQIAEL